MKLWVDPKMDALTRHWVNKEKDLEVQGFFQIEQLDKETLWGHSPILFEQVVSGSSADSDGPGDTALMDFWEAQGKGWNDKPLPYASYGWWHSHGTMKTFLSGTDEATIKKIVSRGYLVSLVLNSKGERFARVDTLVGSEELDNAMQVSLKVDEIEVVGVLSEEESKAADESYDELVSRKVRTVAAGGYAGFHGGSYRGVQGGWRSSQNYKYWNDDAFGAKDIPTGGEVVVINGQQDDDDGWKDYARSRDVKESWVGTVEWDEKGVTFIEDLGGTEVSETTVGWDDKKQLKGNTASIGLPWRLVKRMSRKKGECYTDCEARGYKTVQWKEKVDAVG